uniref:Uncharacterized protein n=1 Tax=viral metagenome TaxID=1070528 RepID=A0A6C0LSQ9_9ZZZZ
MFTENNINNISKKTGAEILDMYVNGKIDELTKCDLSIPIDTRGNNLLHMLASNVDLKVLKKVSENPKCTTYTIVNRVNYDGDLPIHVAMNTDNSLENKHEFIDFLVNKCGARTDIPNRRGQIIELEKSQLNSEEFNKEMSELSQLNHEVVKNLRTLASIRLNSDLKSSECQKNTLHNETNIKSFDHFSNNSFISTESDKNEKYKFILELINSSIPGTNKLSKSNSNTLELFGGHTGTRIIRPKLINSDSSFLTESGTNDSFITRRRDEILRNLHSTMERPKNDSMTTDAYNALLEKIKKYFDVDEEKAKQYRTALKITITREHPELRKRENDALKIKELEKILETEKSAKAAFKKIDMDEILSYMEEQRLKSLERSTEKNEKNSSKKEKDEKNPSIKEPKKVFKKDTKKIVTENGYMMSDDIILSSESF